MKGKGQDWEGSDAREISEDGGRGTAAYAGQRHEEAKRFVGFLRGEGGRFYCLMGIWTPLHGYSDVIRFG